MKRNIDVFDYAGHICKALRKGVLLTTKADGKVNTMTIGWGTIGIEWNKPIFIAYVRESRFTRKVLEKSEEFTVNIPYGEHDGSVLKFCGTQSGRDTDKIRVLNLSTVPGEKISVPGIKEFPLTLECKVLYKQPQAPEHLPPEVITRFYPVTNENSIRDYHIAYYGEIVDAYLIED